MSALPVQTGGSDFTGHSWPCDLCPAVRTTFSCILPMHTLHPCSPVPRMIFTGPSSSWGMEAKLLNTILHPRGWEWGWQWDGWCLVKHRPDRNQRKSWLNGNRAWGQEPCVLAVACWCLQHAQAAGRRPLSLSHVSVSGSNGGHGR